MNSVVEKGVRVDVSNKIQGFIPNLHLANSTFNKKITKMFTIGKKLKCRVWLCLLLWLQIILFTVSKNQNKGEVDEI